MVIQFSTDQRVDFFGTSLLRFCRLIRLVRIVKACAHAKLCVPRQVCFCSAAQVFRLKFMRDLRLMVKGLIAGIKRLGVRGRKLRQASTQHTKPLVLPWPTNEI